MNTDFCRERPPWRSACTRVSERQGRRSLQTLWLFFGKWLKCCRFFTFDRVHAQAVEELSQYTDEQLDVPSEPSHPAFTTHLGAVGFASQHELLHAGQIVLLRRLMGKEAKR